MKIIIPMAGRGSRLRPHTLTVPKPLVPIAGKPIVQRLVESLAASYPGQIEEVAFVIGDFGPGVSEQLHAIARGVGAKGSVYTQDQPLGTAHAILCAGDSLSGNCIVAFADTLFKADFTFNPEEEGIIWVQKVDDPSAFGVVKINSENVITDFVEKSPVFVSDLAIVGIYYFRDGANMRAELQYLIDNNIMDRGEYQLTNALYNMKEKGLKFKSAAIEEWLDCGNKDAVIYTHQRILEISPEAAITHPTATLMEVVLIPPCFVGENAVIEQSVIGPHVSIGHNSTIRSSVIKNSMVQNNSTIENVILADSMIGNKAHLESQPSTLSIGDFSRSKI